MRTPSKNRFTVTLGLRDMRAPDAALQTVTATVNAPHHLGALETVFRERSGAGYVVAGTVTVVEAADEPQAATPAAAGAKKR